MSTTGKVITWTSVIAVLALAGFIFFKFCFVYSEGVNEGDINYFQKEGLSIFDDTGKESPFLTIFIAVLGTCAQMERENIQYRLQSGYKNFREKFIVDSIYSTGSTSKVETPLPVEIPQGVTEL